MRKKHTNVIKFEHPETNLPNKTAENQDLSPINKIFQQIRKNIIGVVLAASALIHIAPLAKTTEHETKITNIAPQIKPKTKLSLVEKMSIKPETAKALEKDVEMIKVAVDQQYKNANKRQESLIEYKKQLKEKDLLAEDFAEINFKKDFFEQGVNQSIIDKAKSNFNTILKQLEKEKPSKPTPEFLANIVERMGGKKESYERTMGVTSKALSLNFGPGTANCNVRMEATIMAFSKLYPKLKDKIKINNFRNHVRAAVTLDDGKTYLLEGNSQTFPDEISTKYKNSLTKYHDQLRLWTGEITQDQFDQKLFIYGPKQATETKSLNITTQISNGINSKIELDDFGNAEESIESSLRGYGQETADTKHKLSPEEKPQLELTREKVLQANFAELQKLDIQPLDDDQPQILELIGNLTKEEALHMLAETKKLNRFSLTIPNLTIDNDAFKELFAVKGLLIINGITSITPEIAKKLATFKCLLLELNGITSITPEITKELAAFKGDLSLNGITSITPEVTKELMAFKGGHLWLGLTSITPEVAKELTAFKGDFLRLKNMKSITKKTAKILKPIEPKLIMIVDITE